MTKWLSYQRLNFPPLARNAALLLTLSALAILIVRFTAFRPAARISGENFFRGIAAGMLVFALVLAAELGMSVVNRRQSRFRRFQSPAARENLESPVDLRIARAVAEAFGWEILLRGAIFSWIAIFSPLLGYLTNAILSGLSAFRGRATFVLVALEVLKGSLLAAIYLANHSLFLTIIARLSGDLFFYAALKTGGITYLAEKLSNAGAPAHLKSVRK